MQFSFECLINVLNNHTSCDSITSSSTQTVVGTPMIGHDVFHQVGNNLIAIALKRDSDLLSDLELHEVDIDNPAGFNYNGERLAMVAQDYVKAFTIDYQNGNEFLKANLSAIPNFNNINKLASLLSFDVKSSFSLGRHGFSYEYQDLLFKEFLNPQVLFAMTNELIENFSNSIITLFNRFIYSYNEHYDQDDKLIYHFQRFTRRSINTVQFLQLVGIEANLDNCQTLVVEYLVNQITFYASKSQVYNQIKDEMRLYTFYMESDEDNFSLRQDIANYYQYGCQSKCLKILELEFIKASGMSWKTYLNGSRFIANIFDSVYLSDFDIKDITIKDNQIHIKTKPKLSLLESDMIKYSCCCMTLNSYKIEDYVARTGIYEDSIILKKNYYSIVGPLTEQIQELKDKYENTISTNDQYQWYSNTLDNLNKQLNTLRLDPDTIKITDQLIKYYGYCDI